MIVYFKNETADTIFIKLGKNDIKLKSGTRVSIDSETNRIQFSCQPDKISTFKVCKIVITKYNFILNAFYDVFINSENTEIRFFEKEVSGNHADNYTFIDIEADNILINSKNFKVADEIIAKSQIEDVNKKDEKLAKIASVFDVMQTICYIGIPALIIFIGVWYYANIKTALMIIIPLTVIGIVVGLIIKKLIGKFNNKLERLNGKYEDLYVNTDSLFDSKYILSIVSS